MIYFFNNNKGIYFKFEKGFFLRDDIHSEDASKFGLTKISSGYTNGIELKDEDPCFSPFTSQDQIWNLAPILAYLADDGFEEARQAGYDMFEYVIRNGHKIYNPYDGGYSQFLNSNYRAYGGSMDGYENGPWRSDGGSGSGGGGSIGGNGGSDGGNGSNGSAHEGGIGQGHTTRDFGESSGKRNAAGGGGGGSEGDGGDGTVLIRGRRYKS